MKKVFVLATAAALAVSCGQNKTARITGSFPGTETHKVYLELITTLDRQIVDSVELNNHGDFKFKVNLPSANPTFINLVCKQNRIPLIVSPGERIRVTSLGDLAYNYSVEGSEDSELLRDFNTLYNEGVKKLDALYYRYTESAQQVSEAERRAMLKEYSDQYLKIKRDHISFIINHANSMAALYALYQRLPNDDVLSTPAGDAIYYQTVYDSLSRHYPDSPHVASLKGDVDQRMGLLTLQHELQEKMKNPQSYPDIVMEDIFGKKHRLADLEGKIVLLDFWSVSGESNSLSNSELKEIYDEYIDKGFEIYQVSMDNTRQVWVNAVQTQKIPWINVNDFTALNGLAARSYGITSVPANVLLDKEGIIAGRNLYGAALRNKLREMTR